MPRTTPPRRLVGRAAVPSSTPSDGSDDTRGVRARLVGVDAFRGLVLAVMILTPVTGEGGSYPLLGHAEWNGFTVADAIFPAFLVTSGVSLAFLLRPPVTRAVVLRLVRRTSALVVLGVAYNAWGAPFDLSTVRLTGVLQLIGIAGALAAAVVLVLRRVTSSLVPVMVVAAVLPVLHGVLLAARSPSCTGPGANCSPFVDLDAAVLGASRLYRAGEAGFDPEGLAVTVVAAALVLLGYLIGEWVRRRPLSGRTVLTVVAAGVGLVVLGLLVDGAQPINKRLHTPAFSALAGGGRGHRCRGAAPPPGHAAPGAARGGRWPGDRGSRGRWWPCRW